MTIYECWLWFFLGMVSLGAILPTVWFGFPFWQIFVYLAIALVSMIRLLAWGIE